MSVLQTQTSEETVATRPPARIATTDFWAELIIKQGVSAAIALYLVYSITGQQREAIARLENAVYSIGLKLDTLSDRLGVDRVSTPTDNRDSRVGRP